MRSFNTIVLSQVNTQVFGNNNTWGLNLQSMKLGERLRQARLHAKLSQEQLGELAGCGQAVVSKIERGDQDTTSYIARLAKACQVSVEWLDEEIGEMLPSARVLVVEEDSPMYLIHQTAQKMDEKTQRQYLKIGNSLVEPEDNGGNGHTEKKRSHQ